MLSGKLMPKTPNGRRRPADVISNAVHVMKIATGEIDEAITDDGKNAAAVALGRRGGLARAKSIKKAERVKIATKAAKSRWKKARQSSQKRVKALTSKNTRTKRPDQ